MHVNTKDSNFNEVINTLIDFARVVLKTDDADRFQELLRACLDVDTVDTYWFRFFRFFKAAAVNLSKNPIFSKAAKAQCRVLAKLKFGPGRFLTMPWRNELTILIRSGYDDAKTAADRRKTVSSNIVPAKIFESSSQFSFLYEIAIKQSLHAQLLTVFYYWEKVFIDCNESQAPTPEQFAHAICIFLTFCVIVSPPNNSVADDYATYLNFLCHTGG